MQPLVVAATVEHPAGVLVDDQHLALEDDVLLVPPEELLGLDRVVHEGDQRRVDRVVEVVDPQVVLDLGDPSVEDRDRALLLVDLVVLVLDHPVGDGGELGVPLHLVLGRTGDDQRRPGLVDEDRVDLVDDREVVAALDALVEAVGHVVAQVVEAELVVRAVGDVGRVGGTALGLRHRRHHHVGGHAEEVVDAAHPLGVVLRQVVVDGHDVDAAPGQRIEVRRQRGDERLALTGLHLGDVAEVERRATHELDVEVPLAEDTLGRLAHRSEGLGHEVVEALAVGDPLLELVGHAAQLVVRHRDEVVLDGVDGPGDPLQLAEDLPFAEAEDLVDDGRHERELPVVV